MKKKTIKKYVKSSYTVFTICVFSMILVNIIFYFYGLICDTSGHYEGGIFAREQLQIVFPIMVSIGIPYTIIAFIKIILYALHQQTSESIK